VRSATSTNADLIGLTDLGRVQPGYVADLLVVDGNPPEKPSVLWATTERHTIIQDGKTI
jgi:imidazolonepropionase-like amidohydrolase